MYWGTFPGVKWPGHEAIPLLPLISLHGVDRENYTFQLPHPAFNAGGKVLIKRPMNFLNRGYIKM